MEKKESKLTVIKDFFYYTIWYHGIKSFHRFITYDLPWGFKNLKNFFKVVWNFRDFSYGYIEAMHKLQLELLLKGIRKYAHEVDEGRLPKEKDMERCIELLKNRINDDFADRCGYRHEGIMKWNSMENDPDIEEIEKESEVSRKELRKLEIEGGQSDEELREIFANARKLEDEELEELYNILKNSPGWWD